MLSGYFDNGAKIGLDEICILDPSYENSPLVDVVTTGANAYIFRMGGDFHTLHVVGGCLRYNQGDAEWYGYQLLLALAAANLGTLAVEEREYPNAFFVRGKVKARCRRGAITNEAWVDYDLTFLQSRQEMPVSIGAASGPHPDPPAEYEGRNSNRTYTFDGASLGLISDEGLEIEVEREVLTNPIPKSYGYRIEDLPYGRKAKLDLNMSYMSSTHGAWNEWWMELVANKGDAPASLVGNGNTFTSCHLLTATAPQGGDQFGHVKANNFQLTFLKDLN